MIIRVLLVISIILNIFFICTLLRWRGGIQKIVCFLASIKNDSYNRHIHMGFTGKSLEDLGSQLNLLMDRFQSMIENVQRLELSQKQLISNISHDIRTPLTSLLGFIEFLKKDAYQTPSKNKEYLDIIHGKALLLCKLIEDFFTLAKLESEDMEIKISKVNLTDIVQEVVASFYYELESNNITPQITMPNKPVYVWGNENGIERMLHNLLSNAIKYGGKGPMIGIDVRKEENKIWVDIWDCGQGISEEEIPFLFTRLYTTEASRNHKLTGSGLGLAITKQLAEKQNGEITVSSVPNEKTTFSFGLIRAKLY